MENYNNNNIYENVLSAYEKLEEYRIIAPPAHTVISPKIGILLDEYGFLGAMPINESAIVPCTEDSECRTSNISPHLIHDNLSYVGNLPGYEKRYEAYISQLVDYVDAVNDPLARNVLNFIKSDMLYLCIEPLIQYIKLAPQKISVVFCTCEVTETINPLWQEYYINQLPVNGVCSITGKASYIPKQFPRNIRYPGDFARLFFGTRDSGSDRPDLCPGYVTGQKIIHTLQYMMSGAE